MPSLCRAKVRQEQDEQRQALSGTGDRSERIRTFNFQDNRVTDHRIGLTVFGVDQVLAGTRLPELVEALKHRDQLDRIALLADSG